MTRRREVFVLAGVLGLVPLSTSGPRSPQLIGMRGQTGPAITYTKADKEFFLTADEIGYVRPGFHITVNSVTIPADLRAVVDLSFTDDNGQPLDRLGNVTPGFLSINLILAWWDPGTRHYTAYTTRQQTSPITGATATQAASEGCNPTSSCTGTMTDISLGHATYKFKQALPADYDITKTHTVAIYATRNTTDIVGKNYFANVEFDFRPDGAAVTDTWDKVSNAACNTCHNPLSAHGGSRQDVKLCVTCHSPQTIDPDTGNTVDFKVMIHKIHRGEDLPSVQAGTPYVIIGNNQSIHNFSDVAFPQDIRNCTTCHNGPDPNNIPSQASVWYTNPSSAACGSCHDDVNFATGANHPAGAQPDSSCAGCHRPQGDQEWDTSVIGAHTVPTKSTQLKGINATILSVTNTAPGQKPTIRFQLTQNDGTAIDPSTFGSDLNALAGGPTTDYARQPFREKASGATVVAGVASYTFTNAIPADATGTWAFSLEARRTVNLNPHPNDSTTVRESLINPVFYAAVTDSTAAPRRHVVDLANCNKCHDQLSLHGGNRLNTELCVVCHNPNATDAQVGTAGRPPDKGPAESIDFKRMIHRIHRGEALTAQGSTDCSTETGTPDAFGCFTIYGFNGSVNNFNEVLFPGDLRDCEKCHAPDTQQVSENPPPGWLATTTLRDWYSPQQHYAASCLGCHDNQAAAAHAFTMTAPFGEACGSCHAPEAEFSVDKVHAR